MKKYTFNVTKIIVMHILIYFSSKIKETGQAKKNTCEEERSYFG